MKNVLLVTFLLLFTSNAIDAKTFRDNSAYAELRQKIQENDANSAWQLATNLEDEHLGDVDFDFLYGLAALQVKENERAVYAFERVVANKPQWLDAQLYLARTYHLMKNYHASNDITQSLINIDAISPKLKASAENLNRQSHAALNKQSLFIPQSVNVSWAMTPI